MSIQNYYRWSLLLPIALPGVSLLLGLVDEPRIPGGVGVFLTFLFYSMLIGGIPYVLFAIGFLLWSRGRDADSVRTAARVSPFLYTVVLMACFVAFAAWNGDLGSDRTGEAMATIGGFALVFGYGYVALAELVRHLLGRRVDSSYGAEPLPAA